jgi:hypothetical protein
VWPQYSEMSHEKISTEHVAGQMYVNEQAAYFLLIFILLATCVSNFGYLRFSSQFIGEATDSLTLACWLLCVSSFLYDFCYQVCGDNKRSGVKGKAIPVTSLDRP